MRYLIVKTKPQDTVLLTYLKRNIGATVGRFSTFYKIYCPENKTKKYFHGISRFKSFCYYCLPYVNNAKLAHEIYKADVELINGEATTKNNYE